MNQYLVDTSVWIEFLRGVKGPSLDVMRSLGTNPGQIVTTEPVMMELRAGTSGSQLARIEAALNRLVLLGIQPHTDFHAAADLYRRARAKGETVRSMVDCLIASIALRKEAILVHRDRDYTLLASIAPDLKVKSAIE